MKTNDIITLIINNIEGGYYHPDMKPLLKGGEKMLDSGESMYGLDRKHGGSDITNSDAGKAFWALIDANYSDKHNNIKYYGDKADGKKISAEVGRKLKDYVNTIITNRLIKYSSFLSNGAKKIVFSNPALLMQFLYACWNGAGNFHTFANVVNAAYSNGIKSADALFNLINDARRKKGGLFVTQAEKLDRLKSELSGGKFGIGIALIAAGVISYFIFKK